MSCAPRRRFTRILQKLDAFAGLAFAADTQDQAAQTLQSRVQQFIAEISNRILFFSLWWKGLDDANAQRLMDVSGDYRYYLEEIAPLQAAHAQRVRGEDRQPQGCDRHRTR